MYTLPVIREYIQRHPTLHGYDPQSPVVESLHWHYANCFAKLGCKGKEVLTMSNEEIERRMDFIVGQQAQFASDIRQLREVQAQTENVVGRLAQATVEGFKALKTLRLRLTRWLVLKSNSLKRNLKPIRNYKSSSR